MDRATVTVPEAARILGIGRSAAYEAARRGELPTIRFGRRIVVLRGQLERMLGLAANGLVAKEGQDNAGSCSPEALSDRDTGQSFAEMEA
jgi:excisionase family DNA binding protein